MSVESIARVLNTVDDRLTPAMRLVLVGIANHDGDGGAWPSIGTLARYAGLKERAVQYAITALVELGYVTVHRQQGGDRATAPRFRPNLYELHIPRGATGCTPLVVHRGARNRRSGVQRAAPEPSYEPPLVTSTDVFTRGAAEPADFEVNVSEPPWATAGIPRDVWLRMQQEASETGLCAALGTRNGSVRTVSADGPEIEAQ